jgi:hypothetical protein
MAREVTTHGMSPDTRSIVSSKNRIYAVPAGSAAGVNNGMLQIGVLSEFSMSEGRSVEPVRGIGYGDVIAELVPGNTDPMQISVTRTALYLANIFQVFGYSAGLNGIVRSLRHHRFPFDIKQEIIFASGLSTSLAPNGYKDAKTEESTSLKFKALITYFEGCWMTSYNTSFSSDTAIVQESVEIMVTDVYDGTGTGYNDGTLTSDSKYSKLWNNP